jgi:hypothetical protein
MHQAVTLPASPKLQGRTAEWVAATPPGKHRLGSPAKGKRGGSDHDSDNASSTDMEDQHVGQAGIMQLLIYWEWCQHVTAYSAV